MLRIEKEFLACVQEKKDEEVGKRKTQKHYTCPFSNCFLQSFSLKSHENISKVEEKSFADRRCSYTVLTVPLHCFFPTKIAEND